jgi:maltokinase
MSESPHAAPDLTGSLDDERIAAWLQEQRWFASKTQTLVAVELIEQAPVTAQLVLALALARYATGTHELYQLPLSRADHNGGESQLDALTDPENARALLAAIENGIELEGARGQFSFRLVGDPSGGSNEPVRAMGVEQSNSSVVFGERLVLKVFRRLEAGINPDLEMLRFLTAAGYENIAPLHGWYEYEGEALAATLGIAQRFIPGGSDGWALALDEIPTAPDTFLTRLQELGTATAKLHNVLAADAGDPAFSPVEPSNESVALLVATLDEEIERVFVRLPDDPRLDPIAGRSQELRERIAARPQIGSGGRHIRIHGDYHLGQTLLTERGWVLLDFEGEPARHLSERRQKRSPLRDVASMLRSFAYATSAVSLQRGVQAPEGFEPRARETFLTAYFDTVDPNLLPGGEAAVNNLLGIFELEKALYELQYELDNRPDWVPIPVAGIARLLEI